MRLCIGAGGELATGSLPGRGAWLCRGEESCFDAAVRRGAIGRALCTVVGAGDLDRVRALLYGVGEEGGATPQVCEDGMSGRRGSARTSDKET